MNAIVLRGDARALPLPDASVDLLVTSPPYWALRDYRDNGESMAGQIGSEPTWQEWLANLVDCTREWARVLKPTGSMFVNLADKYSGSSTSGPPSSSSTLLGNGHRGGGPKIHNMPAFQRPPVRTGIPAKSLVLLPERYVIACADQLGLIVRRDIIWAKPNGLPESVTDLCRSSHEYLFHLVKQPRYYAAVDEIREAYDAPRATRTMGNVDPSRGDFGKPLQRRDAAVTMNPLGKLPGSVWRMTEDETVWDIASQPLTVPAHLGVDHFAAFPMALPRRCVLGWSPPGICVACGEGRRPVVDRTNRPLQKVYNGTLTRVPGHGRQDYRNGVPQVTEATITGYACACTPHTDHPGTGGSSGPSHSAALAAGDYVQTDYSTELWHRPKVGPRREYHFDGWTPPPTRPSVVLDPFGGTGTTALVAAMHGRIGVSIDRSADYTRLARWRCHDPGERAKAAGVPKPPPIPDGMEALF